MDFKSKPHYNWKESPNFLQSLKHPLLATLNILLADKGEILQKIARLQQSRPKGEFGAEAIN